MQTVAAKEYRQKMKLKQRVLPSMTIESKYQILEFKFTKTLEHWIAFENYRTNEAFIRNLFFFLEKFFV